MSYSAVRAAYSSAVSSVGQRGEAHLDHPAGAERVGVDEVGLVDDRLVRLDDLAVDGRVELADRLRRLDLADDLAGGDRRAGLRQVDEHDVTELVGGVGGDADRGDVAVDGDPLVLGGVLQVGQVGHGHFFLE